MNKTLSSKSIYNGKVVKLFVDEIQNEDVVAVREVVRHSGGAAVLAEKDGKFAFVRQYRHPLGEEIYEIPAGTREKGEDPIVTAARELSEECGLIPKNLVLISAFAVSPGYTDEILHVYYADDFEYSNVCLDSDERLVTRWIDKEKALKMLSEHAFIDAKTIIALQWYKNKNG